MAREIHTARKDAIFAPTPPLESLRMVLSMASTKFTGVSRESSLIPQPCWDLLSERRAQIMLIDVSRAYFNAKTSDDEPIYVEVPREAEAAPWMCARLRWHKYGTRRDAEGWQGE